MSRSFFNSRTDSELANGSRGFAAKISLMPSAYGISDEQADAYVALDAQWQAAYTAAFFPFLRTTSEVTTKNVLRRRVKAMASSLGSIIIANPAVSEGERFTLGLSVRAKPSPLAAPGKPQRLSVTLYGNGALILKWTCDNPAGSRGTQYEVWRTVNGGAFALLGMVGVKRFLDSTLPAGATDIIYKIRAARSTKRGEWTLFPISFGGVPRGMSELQVAA